jgi:flagellar motor switch/type III secretory pathway protein FliN
MAAPAPAIEHPVGSADKASPPQPLAQKQESSKPWAESRWRPVEEFACELTVDLPMPDFKIGDLLKLRQGSLIDARLRLGRDLPLRLNGALVGWIEFELVGEHLAVRLTQLA